MVAPLAGRLAGLGLWGRGPGWGAGPAVRLPRALPGPAGPQRLPAGAGTLPAAARGDRALWMAPLLRKPARSFSN